MGQLTWTTIKANLEDDLDLVNENFVDDAELLRLTNDAIDEAEAIIHNLNQGYFETKAPLALIDGTKDYDLPSGIYANKIKEIRYDDGELRYEITRYKRAQNIPGERYLETAIYYRYKLINTTSGGTKIRIYPASLEDSSTNVEVTFIRTAKVLTTGADVCDIPEFIQFIYEHVKYNVYRKERMYQMMADAEKERDRQMNLMIKTLTPMIDDGDNELDINYDAYENHS